MERTVDCKAVEHAMPDLLFDRASVPPVVEAHLAACEPCRQELASMEQTMQVMDGWQVESSNPFWMSRMEARLREEQRQPAHGLGGWFASLRTRLWISNHTMKPAGVAALGLLLAVCGGTWMDLALQSPPPAAQASNTVRDLQSLNENAQVFQTLATLDGPETNNAAGN